MLCRTEGQVEAGVVLAALEVAGYTARQAHATGGCASAASCSSSGRKRVSESALCQLGCEAIPGLDRAADHTRRQGAFDGLDRPEVAD